MRASFSFVLALLLLPPFAACSAPPPRAADAPFTDALLRDEATWGDGRAELTIYDGEERRYGVARPTEIRHIVVREHFSAEERVKADDWREPGAYPVFKLNQIITVPTGTYRYDQGHSSFWRADSGELIKYASTTNDSCGLAYVQGERLSGGAEGRWRQRGFSYWQGMAETDERAAPPDGALFYDELPFRLRMLDWTRASAAPFHAPLMTSVIGSRPAKLAWSEAEFATMRAAAPGSDGGEEEWRVAVRHARGEDVFFFDAESPHGLRRWERFDGTALERRVSRRLAYWELNRPGDERRLAPEAAE